MKKVQGSEKENELLRRYEDRARSFDNSKAYTEQRAAEIANRAQSRKLKREYTPESSSELDTAVVLDEIDRARYKDKMNSKNNDIKAKLKAEAERSNPKGEERKQKKKSGEPSKIKRVTREAFDTWVPLEERHSEKIIEGKKTKLPRGIILSIIIITLSLLLIVGSIVLLASAKREQNELKDEIDALDFEISELQNDLDRKNENADIEIFAEEELGMIKQEHVNAEYIKSNKTDGVVKLESDKLSLRALLEWIFQQLK